MNRNNAHDCREHPQFGFGLSQWPGATMGLWSPMLRGLQALGGGYGAAIAVLHSEWMEFVKHRFQADMNLPQHLATCQAPEVMWQAYVKFLQKIVVDYQKEFGNN